MKGRASLALALAAVLISVDARAQQATDVDVHGKRGSGDTAPSDTLTKNEVRTLPGAFGDPFRAIEVTPGFTPVLSGLPYFYVRGAPPGNVGYYFDGVRVPYLFHFGLGPAVIHPDLVARTDVYKGGYPAAFGRWAGGVVDSVAMPARDHTHGQAQIRLVDAGGLLEVPFAEGKVAVLASARYSYTAALFNLLESDTSLDYRDYQMRISYAATDRDTLSVLAFGAYDLASQRQTVDPATLATSVGSPPPPPGTPEQTIERVLFASEFHRADARWDHVFASGGSSRIAATLGYDRTRVEARRAAEDLFTGLRADFVQPLDAARRIVFRTGADFTVDQYDADPLPQFSDDDDVVARQQHIFAARTDWAGSIRADVVLLPIDRVEVTPGLRLDGYGSGSASALAVDPRIAARFAVTDHVRIIHAYGLASQPPSTPVALPAITIAHLEGGLQRAVQTSAGVEADLPWDITTTATVFHNAYYGLNDALGTAQVELIDIEKSDALLNKSRGNAYGLELGARRKLTKRVSGMVAYTLSRSTRTTATATVLSAYDRTHVASAVLSVDIGAGFRAGARWVAYSGAPFVAAKPAFAAQVVGVPPERSPLFQRLDIRFEKRWKVGKNGGWIAVVLEALNATLSTEVSGYACGTAIVVPGAPPPSPKCVAQIIGPISVPSLGVEGGL